MQPGLFSVSLRLFGISFILVDFFLRSIFTVSPLSFPPFFYVFPFHSCNGKPENYNLNKIETVKQISKLDYGP